MTDPGPVDPDPRDPGRPGRPIRILLCDDHAVVRAGLLALLSSAPGIEVVGEAGGGEEAVVLAARLRPDVVLMDLQLGPGMDGIEATRRIVADAAAGAGAGGGSGSGSGGGSGSDSGSGSGGGPYVLVLTTYDTDADITRAIDAGATGYLLKAERPEELFSAIRAAAEGRTALSPPVAGRVMARMRGSVRPALTDRERDILGQLARGLGNREIARALFISEATVKTHLGRIYDKLGVDTRSGAVAVAKEQRLLP
ncbi:response regulator transcription factor [Streptomyces rectiverticillatus]|uniref:response regulator n=1 Tax=Streptomyces rectiverticillatus TaxID=173860 RepID=UPI0015C306E8|nr:response regulator transcription factor [Streptomyces rectiverticillatus]QLE73434.1 response regulator transcription factor [Streptomyces rectiverticillatus]